VEICSRWKLISKDDYGIDKDFQMMEMGIGIWKYQGLFDDSVTLLLSGRMENGRSIMRMLECIV